jgi:hypothetical protein
MQKRKTLKDQKGSVLIGAIAISILVAIGSIGFLQVSSSGLNSEIQSFESEQAFFAAESGVNLAVTWLSGTPNPFPIIASTTPFGANIRLDNKFDVVVTLTINGNNVDIVSNAYKCASGGPYNGTTRKSRISAQASAASFARFSTFYDGYCNDPTLLSPIDVDPATRTWAGFFGMKFDGRTHINNLVARLNGGSGPSAAWASRTIFSNGLTTVARSPTSDLLYNTYANTHYSNLQGGKLGHFGNNYDYGVEADWPPVTNYVDDLDQVFQDRYVANVDQISMAQTETNGQIMDGVASLSPVKINLPVSGRDDGPHNNDYRPTLTFSVSGGQTRYTYEYINGAGVRQRILNQPITANSGVLISQNNINVRGTVQGKITVATYPQKDICPIGNITVADYNAVTNPTIPLNSNNVIGLASGRTIRFNNQYRQFFLGDAAETQVAMAGGTLTLTASILALNDGKRPDGTYYLDDELGEPYKGCLHFDKTNGLIQYNLDITGNQVLKSYRGMRNAPAGGLDPLNTFTVHPDSRMTDNGLLPLGYPILRTNAGNFIITLKSWLATAY